MSAFRAATLLLVVGWLWWTLNTLSAGSRVEIWSPGRVGSAPADWWVNVTLEPHADDRRLVIEADGRPGEYRSKDYTLEGERAAHIRQHWEKALPAGCYWFVATVWTATRAVARVESRPVSIIGREGNQCPE